MQLLPFLMIELEITAFFERDMLESYLQEFMWKDRFSKSPFDFICSHIANQYAVCSVKLILYMLM